MDLSLYQKMIGANNTSLSQAYINDTIAHENEFFNDSPSFKTVLVNHTQMDCIVSHTKKSTKLELLFRPKSVLGKGMYINYKSDVYLITEFIPNEIYPKATIELCNSVLKWKDETGKVKEHRCVVKRDTYNEKEDRQVNTSDSELLAIVQYNDDTKRIKPTQRFMFGSSVYEIIKFDDVSNVYNEDGYIKFGLKFTNMSTTDDVENQVADNSGNSGWGGW
ncbi:hypothetical protein ABE137_12675 [Brevibacillus laterosporus]|uniref:hypothetical protein n=1 Tax=Brevibacillus laterosporus TaxID=1465 RepID=UPI0006BD6F7C|nr:putative Ig domain-containing protein [Brevibacillus phage Sundance]ALA47843.1 putative Ig domain-containing protein [Brevibacillus phage Sundance]